MMEDKENSISFVNDTLNSSGSLDSSKNLSRKEQLQMWRQTKKPSGPGSAKKLPVKIDLNIPKPTKIVTKPTEQVVQPIQKVAPTKPKEAPKTQPRLQPTKSVVPNTVVKKPEPKVQQQQPQQTQSDADSLSRAEMLRQWRLQKEKSKPKPQQAVSKSKNTLVAGPRPPPSTEKPKATRIVRPEHVFTIPVADLKAKINEAKIQSTPQQSIAALNTLANECNEVTKLAEYWIEIAHYYELSGNMVEVVKAFEEASIQRAQPINKVELGLRAFMLRLRDGFISQIGGTHVNMRDTSVDSDFSFCNSPSANGSNSLLSKSFEEMIHSMNSTDFITEEDLQDDSMDNTKRPSGVTKEEQIQIIKDLVTAVNKLPLESFSGNSPSRIRTTPPKDRSSFQFRVSDVVYHPESSPIINNVTSVTPVETAPPKTPKTPVTSQSMEWKSAEEVVNVNTTSQVTPKSTNTLPVTPKETPQSSKRTPGSGRRRRSPQIEKTPSPTRIWVPKTQSPVVVAAQPVAETPVPASPFTTPKRSARKSFSLAPTPNSALKSKPQRILMDETEKQYEEEQAEQGVINITEKIEGLNLDQFIEDEADSPVSLSTKVVVPEELEEKAATPVHEPFKKPRKSILKTPSVRVPVSDIEEEYRPQLPKEDVASPVSSRSHVVVLTPVPASRSQKQALGVDEVLTPVRRSKRRSTPFKKMNTENMERVLAESEYAYTPNDAIPNRKSMSKNTQVLFAQDAFMSPERKSPATRRREVAASFAEKEDIAQPEAQYEVSIESTVDESHDDFSKYIQSSEPSVDNSQLESFAEEEEDLPRRRRGRKSRTSQVYQRRLTAPVTPMSEMTGRYDTLAEITPAKRSSRKKSVTINVEETGSTSPTSSNKKSLSSRRRSTPARHKAVPSDAPDSPAHIFTPVRRSARLSKGSSLTPSVKGNGSIMYKPNKFLPDFDEHDVLEDLDEE